MNFIKVFLCVCINIVTLQMYGMLTPSVVKSEQSTEIEKYPPLGELLNRYKFKKGLIWDPAMFDSAQETGYIPTEVLVYDRWGDVKKRTIYHGMHVIAVKLDQGSFWDDLRIPGKKISTYISQIVYDRNIKHPVILALHNKEGAFVRRSAGNYTIKLNEKSKSLLFELGHELAHCKLLNEITYNLPVKRNRKN